MSLGSGMGLDAPVKGIGAALSQQQVRAHNLANANTSGFKAKSALQSEGSGGLPEVSTRYNPVPNALKHTGFPEDLAVEGSGFIQVENAKNGETLYRRSVKLQRDEQNRLWDEKGNQVGRLKSESNFIGNLEVEDDGTIWAKPDQGEKVQVGRLIVGRFINPHALEDRGGGSFANPAADSSGFVPGANVKVRQGFEEMSGTDVAGDLTGLSVDKAALSANAAMIRTRDSMLGDLVDLKG